MNNKKVRVRFAPSPTGPLHMGGVRTALYNYLFARKHGGDFLLRIEDTDQARFVQGAEEYIINSLKWSGISPGEGPDLGGNFGPYRQSERKGMYREYADALIESGHAYYAFDTPEELDAMREKLKDAKVAAHQYNAISRSTMRNSLTLSSDEVSDLLANETPYVIRMKVPRNEEVRFEDEIRGWVVVHSANIDDKVLFKSDGMPTYHLANVVDDYLMKISHVIRGEEWLPSAPLHVLLYRYLGWENEMPRFAHLPLILKPDGNGKLSKRDGDRLGFPVFPLEWRDPESSEISSGYRENGYFPEAFVNMIVMLGWNPGTSQELFSLEEMANAFSLDRVGKAGAKFDSEKARWFNQQYLRNTPSNELAEMVRPLMNGTDIDANYLAEVCELMKERAVFPKELIEGAYFFTPPTAYDEKMRSKKWKEDTAGVMKGLVEVFRELEDFTPEQIEAAFKEYLEKNEIGMGSILPNFRLLLTGGATGPALFSVASLIGKEETIRRMETGSEILG